MPKKRYFDFFSFTVSNSYSLQVWLKNGGHFEKMFYKQNMLTAVCWSGVFALLYVSKCLLKAVDKFAYIKE